MLGIFRRSGSRYQPKFLIRVQEAGRARFGPWSGPQFCRCSCRLTFCPFLFISWFRLRCCLRFFAYGSFRSATFLSFLWSTFPSKSLPPFHCFLLVTLWALRRSFEELPLAILLRDLRSWGWWLFLLVIWLQAQYDSFPLFYTKASMRSYCSISCPNHNHHRRWKILQSTQLQYWQDWRYSLSYHWIRTIFLSCFWCSWCSAPFLRFQCGRWYQKAHTDSQDFLWQDWVQLAVPSHNNQESKGRGWKL